MKKVLIATIVLVIAAVAVTAMKRPVQVSEAGWKTTTSDGATFQYPETLDTKYVSLVDWPPKAQVLAEAYSCTQAGTETAQAGKTEERTIRGHKYCVTVESEGAAGSTYNQYAYGFGKDSKTVFLTFTLRLPQCANYDEPKQSECKSEEDNLNIDSIVDRMARTVALSTATAIAPTPVPTPTPTPGGGVACTMEAKLCPDGSYVGRSGPKCEFAACPSVPKTSGVSGVVKIGPTCPVMKYPDDGTCADKPYQTSLLIKNNKTGAEMTTSSNTNGAYQASLVPGSYTISAAKQSTMPSLRPETFTVVANKFTTLDLTFDSGIR